MGTNNMAHLTTVMQISCTAPKSSFTGLSKSSGSDNTATPIIMVKITMLNISPLTIEANGFSGSRSVMAFGISFIPNDSSVLSSVLAKAFA